MPRYEHLNLRDSSPISPEPHQSSQPSEEEVQAQSLGVRFVSSAEPQYKKGEKAGQGADGTVYYAESSADPPKIYALKEIGIHGNTRKFSLLLREIKHLKRFNHYNVLHFEDAYYTKDSINRISDLCIVVTPYAPWTLDSFLLNMDKEDYRKWWPWYPVSSSPGSWHDLIIGLLQGLNHIHGQLPHAIKHRDLKPENILISLTSDERPRPIIADFGSSKEFIIGAATTHERYTKMYEAPEQINPPKGKEPQSTPKTDIFQMGCCLIWVEGAMWGGRDGISGVENAVYRDSHQFSKNMHWVDQHMIGYYGEGVTLSAGYLWSLRGLIKEMVHEKSESRPDTMEILRQLENMIVERNLDWEIFGELVFQLKLEKSNI